MMKNLFLHINVSVDGYICDAEGVIDWHFADAEFQTYLDELLSSIDAIVLGRVAFEQLASYWPSAGPEASPTQVRKMHELPKYVLSRTLTNPSWHNSHVTTTPALAALDGQIALFAGAGAAQSALALGLLDELRLVVNPVVLGGGKRLFDGVMPRTELRLVDTRRFASGAHVLTYAPTAA